MIENSKISTKQIRALIVSTVVGVGILTLPSKVSVITGNDGWIAIIIGGLLTLIPIIFINKIFEFYPDKNFFEIGHELLGRWIFNIFLIMFLVYYIILAASVTRNLAEIVKAFLLETTPTEFIVLTFILVTTYAARSDINIIGRIAYHIYSLIIVFSILLTFVTLTGINYENMLPTLQSDFTQLPKAIGVSFFSYLGFEILLFALPFAEDKKKTLQSSLIGVAIVTVIYVTVFVVSLSQYGLDHLNRQLFPVLSLIKEVDLPGFFLENLDGFVMAVWVLFIFASMGPAYYGAGIILSNLMNTKSHDMFILPLLPIIYIISLIPQSITEVNINLGKIIDYTGLVVIVVLPAILYALGYFKTRRAKR